MSLPATAQVLRFTSAPTSPMKLRNFRPASLCRWAPRSLAFLASALVAWACQDSTGPTARPDDGAAPRLGQASAYYCSTRMATANGIQDGRIPLNFPPESWSADGSVMEYRFRRQTPSGALAYSADCVIPRTMPAVEMMNQRFKVPADLGRPMGRNRKGDEFTTQGCVADGECTLEPIVVVAPPPPSICDVNCDGGGGGTSPGYTGEAGGSGGDGSTSDTPAGEPIADDELVDCHLGDSGTCDRRSASPDTAAMARNLAEKIKAEGICGEAKTMALQMIDNGLEVWSNEIRKSGLLLLGDMAYKFVGSTGTETLKVMHLWTDPRGFNAWTIAHEGLHGLGRQHEDIIKGPDGVSRSMDQTAKYCSGS